MNSNEQIYNEVTLNPISLDKLSMLIKELKDKNKIYSSKSDMNNEYHLRMINNSLLDDDYLFELDNWFGSDANANMIFMFICSLISLLCFVFVIILCYKDDKIRCLIRYWIPRRKVKEQVKQVVIDTPMSMEVENITPIITPAMSEHIKFNVTRNINIKKKESLKSSDDLLYPVE